MTGHALRTLAFNTDETYQAADTIWSGTFQFYQDSAQVLLTPFDPDEIPCMLSINAITDTSVHFSSPQVSVNPQSASATSYQQFVAYEALTFLSLNGINSDSIRTVKIEFDYYTAISN